MNKPPFFIILKISEKANLYSGKCSKILKNNTLLYFLEGMLNFFVKSE